MIGKIGSRFRGLRLLALSLAAMLWVAACSSGGQQSGSSAQPLLVGLNTWSGYSGHHVAMKKGFYEQAGLNVQDTVFQSDSEEMTAFLAGKLDIAWLPSGDVVQMVAQNPAMKVVFLVDYSNGADGILGRDIKTPADLKGKTIARENILFENVLLRAYLERGGLTEKDVTIKDLSAPDAATAFTAKRVDAAVTYEPYLTKAAKEGNGAVIFSTKDTNLIVDVVVVSQKLLDTRKAELISYFKAADKGIKLLMAGDTDALKAAAEKLGITSEELKGQLSGIRLFDIESNKKVGFNLNDPNNVIKNFELTAKAAYDLKVIPKPVDPKSLYDMSVLDAL